MAKSKTYMACYRAAKSRSSVEQRSVFQPSFNMEAIIVGDLGKYAGKSWNKGLSGVVFARVFRVWQEGGESRHASIMEPMIDAALRGFGRDAQNARRDWKAV